MGNEESKFYKLRAPIFTLALAIGGPLVVQTYVDWKQTCNERKSIESAFVGEIEALLQLIQERKLVEQIWCAQKKIEVTGDIEFADFRVSDPNNYLHVYPNTISKLGLLKAPLPKLLTKFYTNAYFIVDELNWMANSNGKGSQITKKDAVEESKMLLDVLKETIKEGNDIIKTIYPEIKKIDPEIKKIDCE
jgi:hypothetical protein